MRLRLLAAAFLGTIVLGACAETDYYSAPPRHPEGPAYSAEVGVFYDDLLPYGSWITVASYGDVWVPRVPAWWRPYSEGHWVYTDDGWTWIADEPWGWAAFHYGRWYFDDRWGWVWVPGRVWAPAWVAWRTGGGHVGWAPLPPQVRWEGGGEFEPGSYDFDRYIRPQHWCFVEERHFTAPRIHEHLVPTSRSVSYVRDTRNVTRYGFADNRVVNRGLEVSQVERVTDHAVPRYRVVDRPGPGATTASDGQVSIYRPVGPGGAANRTRPPRSEPRPMPPAQEIRQRQDAERRELQRHQQEERERVRQLQESESRAASERARADQVKRQHDAEQRALAKQQQQEQQALARRQKEERSTHAQPRPASDSKKEKDPDKKKDKNSGR